MSSFCMKSLKIQGARWPRGSIETIFLASAHCGKGPIFTAGSVSEKSGRCSISKSLLATARAWYMEYEPPWAPIAKERIR